MAQFEQWFNQDFTEKIEIRHCESVMFTGDDKGALVGVRLFSDGAAYSGGGTVTGAVKRSDGGLVALTGTLSGNAASVVIPAAALAYPGPIGVHIVLNQGGSVTTVLKAIYSVDDNSGVAVDPGTIIPSVNDLITAINTAVASIPSDYSALLHALAPDFSASSAYVSGDYVWYNGALYCFISNHAAGSWTGTDAQAAVVGNDLSSLKSALSNYFAVSADRATSIPDNSDLNDYRTAGTYKVTSNTHAATMTNIPAKVAGKLLVIELSTTNRLVQWYLLVNTSTGSAFYQRYYDGSAWTTWSYYVKSEMFNTLVSRVDTLDSKLESEISNYFAVSADRATTIPDNSDMNDYRTPGTYKVTNSTHAATMTNMPAKVPGKLLVIELSAVNRLVQWYLLANTSTGSAFYQRYYDGSTWTAWNYYIKNEMFNTLVSRVDALDKKISVSYESGTWGDGTERLNIYIPTYTGYILFRMYHYINNDPTDKSYNCNCWQIANAYYVDDNKGNATQFTISGEWECAIKLAKNEEFPSSDTRNDFSGGHTHGDEIFQSITVQLDGKPVSMNELATMATCDELRIIRTSKMYDPENHITEIAEHGVEYVFNKSTGLTINQSLKWLVAELLANCFLAMFLPSKNYIDRACVNSDFVVLELPSSTGGTFETIVKQNANKADMWDTATGVSAVVSVPVYPIGLAGGDRISISDNGGLDYNKLYFKVCSGHTSTIGELWKSTTVYKIDYLAPAT